MKPFRLAPFVCHHSSLTNYRRFFLAVLALISLLTAPLLTHAQKPLLKTRAETKKDEDQPEQKAQWMMRGREVAPGESAGALRFKAYQQKMVLRAARRAQATARGAVAPLAPVTPWVALGPAPLASDATGGGFQDYNWVSGRATTVVIDPSDATGNTILLGGAYGGVWKSTNAGSKSATPDLVTWHSLIDDQPTLAVGAIALKPGNSNVILVGTGEANSSGDSYYGVGILRSTDGGASWTQITSAASGQSFLGIGFKWIVFSTSNPNLVVASTAGDLGFDFGLEQDGVSTARGLYYSTDAGATWNRVTLSDNAVAASATGVVYDPTQSATGTFYAAIRRHGIYSSTDGQHFTRLTTQPTAGLASANCPGGSNVGTCPIYRAEFAARPGRSEMYVWIVDVTNIGEVDEGIWQTTDGGSTWSQVLDNGIGNCGQGTQPGTADGGCGVSQGAYNLELAAVPNGADTDLYAGTINIFKCRLTSGTSTCATIDPGIPNDWINLTHVYGCTIAGENAHVHPDQHGLAFMVVGGKSPGYFAHDGGISRTLDGFTGLNSGTCTTSNQFDSLAQTLGSMSEFLSFSVHPTSQDIMLGGTQDNGSPKTGTATSSTSWQNALSGDGGFNVINPNAQVPASGGDSIPGDEWFVSQPFSTIGGCEAGTACNDSNTFLEAQSGYPNNGNIDQGPFYTNFMLDPQDSNEMIIGTCRIWRGDSFSSVFTQLSFNFDTQTAALCNGNEINQVAGLDVGGPKDASGFSKVIYATTWGYGPFANLGTGGEVWVTTDASVASPVFKNITGSINSNNYAISSVAMDHSDATGKTAYVGIMGFHTSHVFQTTNAGTSWTDWTGTLPDAPVDALLVDSEYGNVYVTTDVGVFVSPISGGPSWTEVGTAAAPGAAGFLPNVPVTAIRIFNAGGGGTKKLRVSTYGRGVWEYDITPNFSVPTPLTDPAAANPGQSTHTSVMISPVGSGNFVGKMTYSCSGLPAGTTCTFSPASLPSNSPATSVTVTVSTAGPFTGSLAPRPQTNAKQNQHDRPWLPLGLPVAGMLFLGVAGRKLPRHIQILTLCLTLGLAAFLIACGGGSSSGPPPPVTVQVTPSSVNTLWPNLAGAPTQTVNLTATVNNSTNQNVSWAITANGTDDTVTSTGTNTATYTAPSAMPAGTVVVTATAQADSTAKGSSNISIKTPTPAGSTPITVKVFEGSLEKDTTFNLNIN